MNIVGYIPICKDDETLLPEFLEAWKKHNPEIPVKLLVDVDNPVSDACGLGSHPMVWNKEGVVAPFFAKSLLDAARKDGADFVVKLDVDCIHLAPLFGGVFNYDMVTGYSRHDGEGFYGACYALPTNILEEISSSLMYSKPSNHEEDLGIYFATKTGGHAVFLHNYQGKVCGVDEKVLHTAKDYGFINTHHLVHCGQCGKTKWGRQLTRLVMSSVNSKSRGEVLKPQEDIRKYFARALVVNLEYRPDRWEHFKYEAAKAGFYGFERFNAISGDMCKHPHWWRAGNGAWGCLMSHLRIVQDAQMSGLDNYLVFEDDAVLSKDFMKCVKNAINTLNNREDGWDMLYLGGQHLYQETAPPWHYDDGLVRCNNVNRTHCFAVNGRFMEKFGQHIIHAPDYINAEDDYHIDHQLGDLHRHVVTLAAQPWVVGQAASSSNITGQMTEEMWWDDNGWGK